MHAFSDRAGGLPGRVIGTFRARASLSEGAGFSQVARRYSSGNKVFRATML
jgi:hypothetical protein